MNINIKESKVECDVIFVLKMKPISEPFKALMHLFEHRYDPQTLFWYGVVDIGIDMKEAFDVFLGRSDQGDMMLSITFADGRKGLARSFNGRMEEALFKVSVVGFTSL